MNYSTIFEKKEPFVIKFSSSSSYTFQENEENGELIDKNGNVVAQIFEKDPNKKYFVAAGMFMGDIVFRSIFYKRTMSSEQGPSEVLRTDFENLT